MFKGGSTASRGWTQASERQNESRCSDTWLCCLSRWCHYGTPNSIDPEGEYTFKLIDLGVNYLYTHSLTGRGGPDINYMAPEVRSNKGPQRQTDLYSLGQLLVAFADVGHTTDATVPDGFYAETALMARFVEDLIDRDPKRRLLIFPLKNGAAEWYPELHKFFQEELDAMRLVRGDGVPKILVKLRIAPLVDLVQPLRRAPSQQ